MRTCITLLAAAAASAAMLLSACQTVTVGSPHPQSPPPPGAQAGAPPGAGAGPPATTPPGQGPLVLPDQLDAVLPPVDAVSTVVGAPNLVVLESHKATALIPDGFVSDPACTGAIYNASLPAYADSPEGAVRSQTMKQPDSATSPLVDQGVVQYETVQDAQDEVTSVVNGWGACANKLVSVKTLDAPYQITWAIGTATESNGTHILVNTRSGGGWYCGRGITSRNNLVIDVLMCSPDSAAVGFQAQALADQVAGRVPA
jgi:PknH-like extracellular domain